MKQKTVKTAKKRILKTTKAGKLLRRKLSGQHLTQGKSKRVMSATGKSQAVAKADQKRIKRLIPNG